jgi:hypothetical protein
MKKYFTQKSLEKFFLSISGQTNPLEIATLQRPITLPDGGIVHHPPTTLIISGPNLLIRERIGEYSFPLDNLSVEWFRLNGIRPPL